jgi:hypothetical protein
MADEISPLEIQDFIDAGLDRIYPEKWKRSIDIFSAIETEGIGILVIHDSKYQRIDIKAGVLTGLTFSPELVADVGEMNTGIAVGAYVLYEGNPEYWRLKYSIKLRYNWVDPQSRSSALMILNSLHVVPDAVNKGIERLSPKHGGEPWGRPPDPEEAFSWALHIGDADDISRIMSWLNEAS